MKVLVVPTPSTGHLLAMVPFCWALRLAGHDVLVAARRDATATALRSGLQAADLPELQVPMDELRKAVNPSMFPAPVFADRDQPTGQGMWHFAAQSWFGQAGQYLDAYVAVAKDWGADMVLSDPLATVGRALGAALELPVLVHRWGVDPTGGPFAERTAALAAESGTALADPAAILDICPASLQAPDAPAGTALRFIPFNGTGLLPEWHRNTEGRKRIAVCLGGSTLSLTGPRPLLAILDAVRRVDAEVIVTLSAADRASVGALPDGVRVVEDVPLQLFLPDCDLLIHHGGSTTGFTACRYGVPQLVLPQMFDQFDYARGITRTGAGLAAVDAAAQADIDALTDSIANLLRDSAFRDGAEQVGRDILAAPSPHEVVARIVAPRAG
ncbi:MULTISPECIES: nucleotide disphospho-sugar-binding domain-containing protein [unclassified Nocardia]|uniref:nucleotide disphospho-sugar-binding domain-containing protein n=1 Tax=unclassified Nocardia TaxID=2637762 RepID=UPI001CE4B4FF|nr:MULTISPECIES: nucleotide disphospho-sugar-binding domain-containing protein [unclassified Nocardia]